MSPKYIVGHHYRVAHSSVVAPNMGLVRGGVVVLQEIDMTTRAETLFWVKHPDSKRPAVPLYEEDLCLPGDL